MRRGSSPFSIKTRTSKGKDKVQRSEPFYQFPLSKYYNMNISSNSHQNTGNPNSSAATLNSSNIQHQRKVTFSKRNIILQLRTNTVPTNMYEYQYMLNIKERQDAQRRKELSIQRNKQTLLNKQDNNDTKKKNKVQQNQNNLQQNKVQQQNNDDQITVFQINTDKIFEVADAKTQEIQTMQVLDEGSIHQIQSWWLTQQQAKTADIIILPLQQYKVQQIHHKLTNQQQPIQQSLEQINNDSINQQQSLHQLQEEIQDKPLCFVDNSQVSSLVDSQFQVYKEKDNTQQNSIQGTSQEGSQEQQKMQSIDKIKSNKFDNAHNDQQVISKYKKKNAFGSRQLKNLAIGCDNTLFSAPPNQFDYIIDGKRHSVRIKYKMLQQLKEKKVKIRPSRKISKQKVCIECGMRKPTQSPKMVNMQCNQDSYCIKCVGKIYQKKYSLPAERINLH